MDRTSPKKHLLIWTIIQPKKKTKKTKRPTATKRVSLLFPTSKYKSNCTGQESYLWIDGTIKISIYYIRNQRLKTRDHTVNVQS